jgi:hypothetical protein
MNSLEVLGERLLWPLCVPHCLRDFMREKLAPGRSRRLAFYSQFPRSRSAAKECSPRRKRWGNKIEKSKPRRVGVRTHPDGTSISLTESI